MSVLSFQSAKRVLRVGLLGLAVGFASSAAIAQEGVIAVKSPHSVAGTLDKLSMVLESKGMKVFTRVNHAAGAEGAGLTLRPTEVLVFGNPKVGTPLMNCAQSVAIDLPQKMLAWEAEDGQVYLGYNDPMYMKTRHGIEGCDAVLEKVAGALGNFAKAATAE